MFLQKIEFDNAFLPFKAGEKITFRWEKESQRIIEFYLKTISKIKEWEKLYSYEQNAKRFKINIVLGNNWWWKSRLFEGILNYPNTPSWILNYEDVFSGIKKQSIDEIENDIRGKNIILDDFFKLSNNFTQSVNKDILNSDNYNLFYCDVLSFLNSKETSKNIFSSFLNLKENYKYNLNIEVNSKWKTFFGWSEISIMSPTQESYENNKDLIDEEIDYDISLSLFTFLSDALKNNSQHWNLNKIFDDDKAYIKNLWLSASDLFIATVNHFYYHMSIDDKFTKEMLPSNEGVLGFKQYTDFKKVLALLWEYLKFFDNDYIWTLKINEKWLKKKRASFLNSLTIIKKNLSYLEELLLIVEESRDEWSALDKKLEYGFQNAWYRDWTSKLNSHLFIDKLQGSKYSSQSKYLLVNLLYWFSDSVFYDEGVKSNLNENKVKKNNSAILDFRSMIHEIVYNLNHWPYFPIINYSEKVKLSQLERSILAFPIFKLNLSFEDSLWKKDFNSLSAWEKTMLVRFTNIYMRILEDSHNDNLILIDEPDLHLHLDWQKKYMQRLIDVFSALNLDINLHFIIATHSPFIISDLPEKSIVLLDKSVENIHKGEFTEVRRYENKTFASNFVNVIKDGFYFQDKVLMWSFAEINIHWLSIAHKFLLVGLDKIDNKRLNEKEIRIYNYLLAYGGEDIKKMIDEIWDDFLKENLLYL